MPIISNFPSGGKPRWTVHDPAANEVKLDLNASTVGTDKDGVPVHYSEADSDPTTNMYQFMISERSVKTGEDGQSYVPMRLCAQANIWGQRDGSVILNRKQYQGETVEEDSPDGVPVPVVFTDQNTTANRLPDWRGSISVAVVGADGKDRVEGTIAIKKLSADNAMEWIKIKTTDGGERLAEQVLTEDGLPTYRTIEGQQYQVYRAAVSAQDALIGSAKITGHAKDIASILYLNTKVNDPNSSLTYNKAALLGRAANEYYKSYKPLPNLYQAAKGTATADADKQDHAYLEVEAADGSRSYYVVDMYLAEDSNRNLALWDMDTNEQAYLAEGEELQDDAQYAVWVYPAGIDISTALPNVAVTNWITDETTGKRIRPSGFAVTVPAGTTDLVLVAQTEYPYAQVTIGRLREAGSPAPDKEINGNTFMTNRFLSTEIFSEPFSFTNGETLKIAARTENEGVSGEDLASYDYYDLTVTVMAEGGNV